ncbi:STAS domain-containing protein [Azospirillum sp. sgz302134]
MQHRIERERHFARLVLTGRFTGQDADAVRRVIADIKGGPERRYLLDLSGLGFIDSAGIGMMLVINGEAASVGKHLAMLAAGGPVKKVVELTRIAMIIPVFETVEDYVAASVPEALLAAAHPCAPGEDPLAVAARALNTIVPLQHPDR